MNTDERLGIIDIGSNSIRLVIYEQTKHKAHRVIDESKESARLSSLVRKDGSIALDSLSFIIQTLHRFQMICLLNHTRNIRAVATAAIRNASNRSEIIEHLEKQTKLQIILLSGEEEARLGFLGTINTLAIQNGFLVDIGGGSTEITLFHNRSIVHSVSLSIGAVNAARIVAEYSVEKGFKHLQHLIETELTKLKWIKQHPSLPLVGLGGTFRNVGKMSQKMKQYSLQTTHNYELQGEEVYNLFQSLKNKSSEQLKKIEGLSKDRADLILPGMIILQTIFKQVNASHYIISGSGLRDGIFFEHISPNSPVINDVLQYSIENLLSLHPSIPKSHVQQVNKLALQISDYFIQEKLLHKSSRTLLHTASLLYRIGVSVDFYGYHQHNFYLIANSRINGFTHRETLLCALIASFKTKKHCRRLYLQHKDILTAQDLTMAVQLGTLLNLAAALDRSQIQHISIERISTQKKQLFLHVQSDQSILIEEREIELLAKEFVRVWKIRPRLSLTSMN